MFLAWYFFAPYSFCCFICFCAFGFSLFCSSHYFLSCFVFFVVLRYVVLLLYHCFKQFAFVFPFLLHIVVVMLCEFSSPKTSWSFLQKNCWRIFFLLAFTGKLVLADLHKLKSSCMGKNPRWIAHLPDRRFPHQLSQVLLLGFQGRIAEDWRFKGEMAHAVKYAAYHCMCSVHLSIYVFHLFGDQATIAAKHVSTPPQSENSARYDLSPIKIRLSFTGGPAPPQNLPQFWPPAQCF